MVAIAASTISSAEIHEWALADNVLSERTTSALKRYYTLVVSDSVRVRYIAKNSVALPYRLRAVSTENDTLGQLISITLGQLSIGPSNTLRIALGDDLYQSLLMSRNDPASLDAPAPGSNGFADDTWHNDTHGSIAFDRICYRFDDAMAAFAAVGAPESNLYWWSDATARIGLATPTWEFAVLVPLGAGATPVGPLRERLLSPGYGAAAMATIDRFNIRLRFSSVGEPALNSPLNTDQAYVHTLSAQLAYTGELAGTFGTVRFTTGLGYEEFTAAYAGPSGEPILNGRVRRLSPLADLALLIPQGTFRFNLGVNDLALRGGIAVRLTHRFWLETSLVANDVIREHKPFEHPFQLFLTPRITF
jgi:hypothetical protein